jgi:hypothetical protein
MSESITELGVLRGADETVDEQRLVRDVGELQPGWSDLERYSGPLPAQAVRAYEVAIELALGESGANPQ